MIGLLPLSKEEDRSFGLSMCTFCIFFLPIIPLGTYLVKANYPKYEFFGRVPYAAYRKALGPGDTAKYLGGVFGQGIMMVAMVVGLYFGLLYLTDDGL